MKLQKSGTWYRGYADKFWSYPSRIDGNLYMAGNL